jgi:diketogulonate reductase-like aldo/keto reductase
MEKPEDGRDAATVEARGVTVPRPGFGTWSLEGNEGREMIEAAVDMGYRHFDAAEDYGNEEEVGRVLEASGLLRREFFLTSKVWPTHYGSMDFRQAVEGILERLRTDYLDLLLLHWPVFEDTTLEAVVERLNAMRDEELTLNIGLSNFTVDLLDRAWAATTYPLVVNQVEYHPFLDQEAVMDEMRDREMILTAYCPLARGRTARNPVLREIGETHGKTGAQVSLRWLVQQNTVPIPRTSDPEHGRENMEIFDFELSGEEMERIHELHEPDGRIIEPSGMTPPFSRTR